MLDNLNRVILGKPEAVNLALVALLADGHLLIEDVPGIGKTLLAKALARSLGCTFHRIQFTPDLLPGDLLGTSVYDQSSSAFVFQPGPLFAQVVLADEMNRATPRTQSALLEAMEDRQVSMDGKRTRCRRPFLIVATQNPLRVRGHLSAAESQLDRFMIVCADDLPEPGARAQDTRGVRAARQHAARFRGRANSRKGRRRRGARGACQRAHVGRARGYVLDIVAASRQTSNVGLGLSSRAALALARCARIEAALRGAEFVVPDDVKRVAGPVLAHRLVLSGGSDVSAGRAVVRQVVESVAVPADDRRQSARCAPPCGEPGGRRAGADRRRHLRHRPHDRLGLADGPAVCADRRARSRGVVAAARAPKGPAQSVHATRRDRGRSLTVNAWCRYAQAACRAGWSSPQDHGSRSTDRPRVRSSGSTRASRRAREVVVDVTSAWPLGLVPWRRRLHLRLARPIEVGPAPIDTEVTPPDARGNGETNDRHRDGADGDVVRGPRVRAR